MRKLREKKFNESFEWIVETWVLLHVESITGV